MPQRFIFFPLLPPELRLQIWNYAFSFFPRVIEVRPQILNYDIPFEYRQWDAMASTMITLLQVNREARYELLPRYSTPFSPRRICSYYGTSLLVNYEIDTLYFRVSLLSNVPRKMLFKHIFEDAETEVKDNLRSLAGNDMFWRNMIPASNVDPSLQFLKFESFKKLEEVIIICYLEQRLDDAYGVLPRLERFKECEPRGDYEARYLPWFRDGFNRIPRSVPRSIKLCQEVGKLGLGSAL